MDETDRRLVALLRENSRASYTALAEAVGASESTVRARVNRMVEDKVIERFTIRTGAGNVKAIVDIRLESHAESDQIAETISQWPDVESVLEVTGDEDILVVADCGSSAELNDLIDRIRQIEGTQTTHSRLVLKER